jgi:DNA-binding MarR family transcriptional regulator
LSIEALNWALNVVVGITATQKAILVSLADRADENAQCYPSYDDICKRSCANRKTVTAALKKLEDAKLIKRTRRFSKSTIYTLAISTKIGSISSSTEIGSIISTKIGSMDRPDIGTLTINEPPIEPSYKKRFAEFWDKYPKKAAKPKAEQAFKKLSKKDQDALISSLSGYPFSNEKNFIPYPATFINQRRWEDEQDNTTTKSTGFEI